MNNIIQLILSYVLNILYCCVLVYYKSIPYFSKKKNFLHLMSQELTHVVSITNFTFTDEA